jgi:putative phage-type endonuclease
MMNHDLHNISIVQSEALKVIDQYTKENPLFMSSPKYKESLISHVIREIDGTIEDASLPLSLIQILDNELWNTMQDPNTKYLKTKMKSGRLKVLKLCVGNAVDIHMSLHFMHRSESLAKYRCAEVDKNRITGIIDYVRNKPQPPQRTPAWYEFRNNLITASNAWKAFKSKSTKAQLISEKCKELDISKYDTTSVNTNTAFHHGTKYEEISVMFYEYKHKTKVEDFGCIRHDVYHCLGASPDGINTSITSPLYGRMLEIKNPVSREITGIPKEDYWIQMQLQMEVCNLDVCDFLETLIKEYDDEDDFISDSYHKDEDTDAETGEKYTPFTHTAKKQLKGIIMYFSGKNGPVYEYMPLYISKEEYEKWSTDMFNKHEDITWLKNIYWYMKEYSCVVVERNKHWFRNAIPHIQDIWKQVETQRKKGVVKNTPPSRPRTRSRSNSMMEDTNIPYANPFEACCLLNLDEGDCVSVAVGIESSRENEERQIEKENMLMLREDTDTTIYELLDSILVNVEKSIQEMEEEKRKKNLISSTTSTTSTTSSPPITQNSPMTRATKKKRERKEKENKKVENVIYIDT